MDQLKRIDRKLIHRGTILDIYEDTMQLPNGKTEKWDFVSHRMGAACVLAVEPDGKILMVRQYRNALERETLEVPAGKRDSLNEDTSICAARELEEETGYKAGKLEKILSLKSTVAFCDEMIDVYLATDLQKLGGQHLDESEDINVESWKLEDLMEMCYSGKIQDAKTVAAIMAYAARR
ncbi:ADP-ribose pyrophosphatase [Pseudobutyrivibrio sp. ACV-2]|uniref:NUDIX hydrolase n=1 Tax=Pseudobutyrivibrio sp. ACV-2 TaxID=1520801 RepID=UPI00089A5F86|nr:NUDIX hydrolase [Pseudobutyrivibrio sp. ACV-2]SEA59803.1 ADP-ribose pyrophosphatase [Pseudobutyrivibrio sp. ACV-2]